LSGVGDFSGDGTEDILWTNTSGRTSTWDLDAFGDVLTGGTGRDQFVISALNEIGKLITDFQAGGGGDYLNIDALLTAVGYAGSNGIADGVVRLVQNGAATEVDVLASATLGFITAATLQNVNAGTLTPDNFIT
jgi:hypothetical protein